MDMKATGIVRRIDSLGRIVIPKELRNTLRIREGEPLEIFTAGQGDVIFRKYSLVGELDGYAEKYAEVLAAALKTPVVICDLDKVVAAAPARKREIISKRLSQEMDEALKKKKSGLYEQDQLFLCEDGEPVGVLAPVLAAGAVIGGVAALFKEDRAEPYDEQALARMETAAGLLAAQCE